MAPPRRSVLVASAAPVRRGGPTAAHASPPSSFGVRRPFASLPKAAAAADAVPVVGRGAVLRLPCLVIAAFPGVAAAEDRPARMAQPPPPDVAGPPADDASVVCEASGLCSRILVEAEDPNATRPEQLDLVQVDYTGWTTDGKMFDTSAIRGKPATFPLNQLITGWTEGLQLMRVGETRRMWIPEKLAYRGTPGRPKGMLVFDVTLRGVTPGPPTPKPPADIKDPPTNAEVDSRGVKSVVVTPAPDGARRPTPKGKASISFACWSEDGKLIDASVLRGGPQTVLIQGSFLLAPIIALMSEGETRRIWVPNKVAFTSAPPDTAPKGMLVFELKVEKVLE